MFEIAVPHGASTHASFFGDLTRRRTSGEMHSGDRAARLDGLTSADLA